MSNTSKISHLPPPAGQGVIPSLAIIHDNESFDVQWQACNDGPDDSDGYVDRLEIFSIPEGCPPSDDKDHPLLDSFDVMQPALAAQKATEVTSKTVGPYAKGAILLRVTVDVNGTAASVDSNCINIIEAE